MKGIQAWDCRSFHPSCPETTVLDVGGFKYLWCPDCKCLCNLEAVSPKFQDVEGARASTSHPTEVVHG